MSEPLSPAQQVVEALDEDVLCRLEERARKTIEKHELELSAYKSREKPDDILCEECHWANRELAMISIAREQAAREREKDERIAELERMVRGGMQVMYTASERAKKIRGDDHQLSQLAYLLSAAADNQKRRLEGIKPSDEEVR